MSHSVLFLALQVCVASAGTVGLPGTKGGHLFCFSSDGGKLVVIGHLPDADWAIWDLKSGTKTAVGDMKAGGAHAAAFSRNGEELIVAGDSGELRVFDARTGKGLASLAGHRASLSGAALVPRGKYLLSVARGDSTIRVWDLVARKPFAKYCFTSKNPTLNVWQHTRDEDHEKAPNNIIFDEPIGSLHDVAIDKTGTLMAVPTITETVLLMEPLTGKITKRIHCKHIKRSAAAAFSSDGEWLAIGGAVENPCIEIWDVAKDRLVRVLEKHEFNAIALAFSPKKDLLASGGTKDGARVWDLKNGEEKYRLHWKGENRSVRCVGFLPDGNTLLTLCENEPLQFWEAATGRPITPKKTP